MDGPNSGHDIQRCYDVTELTLNMVFDELFAQRVSLPGMILKPNMIVPGLNGPQVPAAEIAEMTVACLKATVPPAVPGIAFLSGGQTEEQATENLSLMNAMGGLPWALTFSYGRALQQAALKAWGGKPENVAAGQAAFTHRAKMNGMAASGTWSAANEKMAA